VDDAAAVPEQAIEEIGIGRPSDDLLDEIVHAVERIGPVLAQDQIKDSADDADAEHGSTDAAEKQRERDQQQLAAQQQGACRGASYGKSGPPKYW
jgi:hypothetical protein